MVPSLRVGASYSRADVLRELGLDDPGGGAWYTGLVKHEDQHFIFCGIRTRGRTGHDYDNHFDGPDLVWHGRTGAAATHPSIQGLISGGTVHVFYREHERAPFTYAGRAIPIRVVDVVPVEIRWSFRGDPGPHPEFLAEELDASEGVLEGASRQILVNVYERDPGARLRCIRRWGTSCVICGFNFSEAYGEIGDGFIHVHHLRPLAEVGEQYVLDPEHDLRPVCPNCHAMLHRTRPVLSVDELRTKLRKRS